MPSQKRKAVVPVAAALGVAFVVVGLVAVVVAVVVFVIVVGVVIASDAAGVRDTSDAMTAFHIGVVFPICALYHSM